MEKQARGSLNHGLESSRKAEESWRVLAKALKWGRAKLPGFRIDGHAEEWCWGHLEGSKAGGGGTSLFSQGAWEVSYGPPEIMETITTNCVLWGAGVGGVNGKERWVPPGKWTLTQGGETFTYN